MDELIEASEPRHVEILDRIHDMSTQPLSKFTLFPKLPLELRQKIWRATFPQRTSRFVLVDSPNIDPKPDFTPPITALVNRESHLETLRCYHILETNDHGWCHWETHSWSRKCNRHIIFWNPDTCTLSANFVELRGHHLSKFFWRDNFAPSSS
jgi:hypothetical protein